jgi:uridylate kinase
LRVVIRIGGSVVASPINPLLIKEYIILLNYLKKQGCEIVAVVGGGSRAREFITVSGELHLPYSERDQGAIDVSRSNAKLFARGLRRDGIFVSSLDKVEWYLRSGKVVVMGGLHPGMTTDTVAALVGEKVGADLLVKASNVDGIFTKDPKKYPDAEKLDALGFDDLDRLFEEDRHRAGIHQILDPEAVKILRRCRLKTVVVNGFDVKNVLSAVKGKKVGTVVE